MCSTKCNLKFFPRSNELQYSSNRLKDEDEDEEDLRFCGSRSEPKDALEVDLDAEILDTPTKDDQVNFETAFEKVAKPHRVQNISDSKETTVHIDLDAEVNSLSVSLDESALPPVAQVLNHSLDRSADVNVDFVQEEIKEIEKFRFVHIASDLVTEGHGVIHFSQQLLKA